MIDRAARLRVVVIMSSFRPREGGAERQLRQVAAVMVQRGVEVTVITERVPGAPITEEIDGVRVVRTGSPRAASLHPRLFVVSFIIGAVLRGLRAGKVSAVLSTNFGSATTAAAVVAAVRRARRVVRLTGGGAGQANATEIERRLLTWRGRLLLRIGLHGCSAVVAPAEHLLEAVHRELAGHDVTTRLIPNGVAVAATTEPNAGVPDGCILWYGRAGAAKNADDFFAVARELPDRDFVVIGQVYDDAPTNVTQLGWVDEPERLFVHTAAVLSTSLSEGSPNLCLQAIAHGVRVVGYEIDGLVELRHLHGDAVVLDASLVPASLARTLADALDRPVTETTFRGSAVPSIEEATDEWLELLVADPGR